MNLKELTGHESGIVVYEPEGQQKEAIVLNWAGIDGLPRLSPLGIGIVSLGEELPDVEGEDCDDLGALLDDNVTIIYANGEDMPKRGKVYRLDYFDAVVLAPEDWQ